MSIPLFGVVNNSEMENIVVEVLRSGKIASGDYVNKFESAFGNLISAENVVSTIDMTSAVHLALYLSKVCAGDEVITTSFSCMSTNSPIAAIGATAVWVDLIPDTVCMDPQQLRSAITPKTKAVVLYHAAGYPGYAKEIAQICKENNIRLIEDCNSALLAKRDSQLVGSCGDYSIYSFYPNRQINATEGGALVCKAQSDADKAKNLRRFGIDGKQFRLASGEINSKYNISEVGWGYTMNNLCAALAFTQVGSVSERIALARNIASIYKEKFKNCTSFYCMKEASGAEVSNWVFLLMVKNRDVMLGYLKSKGISASTLHQSNHVYSCFGDHPSKNNLPATGFLQQHVIAIPCGWWLSNDNVSYITEVICEFDALGNK